MEGRKRLVCQVVCNLFVECLHDFEAFVKSHMDVMLLPLIISKHMTAIFVCSYASNNSIVCHFS
jgi:hypothetical protein